MLYSLLKIKLNANKKDTKKLKKVKKKNILLHEAFYKNCNYENIRFEIQWHLRPQRTTKSWFLKEQSISSLYNFLLNLDKDLLHGIY